MTLSPPQWRAARACIRSLAAWIPLRVTLRSMPTMLVSHAARIPPRAACRLPQSTMTPLPTLMTDHARSFHHHRRRRRQRRRPRRPHPLRHPCLHSPRNRHRLLRCHQAHRRLRSAPRPCRHPRLSRLSRLKRHRPPRPSRRRRPTFTMMAGSSSPFAP